MTYTAVQGPHHAWCICRKLLSPPTCFARRRPPRQAPGQQKIPRLYHWDDSQAASCQVLVGRLQCLALWSAQPRCFWLDRMKLRQFLSLLQSQSPKDVERLGWSRRGEGQELGGGSQGADSVHALATPAVQAPFRAVLFSGTQIYSWFSQLVVPIFVKIRKYLMPLVLAENPRFPTGSTSCDYPYIQHPVSPSAFHEAQNTVE